MSKLKLNKMVMEDDRLCVEVNDFFDVHIIRTDEGIVVDIYPTNDTIEFDGALGSTYVFDQEVMTEEEYELAI
jgi:hypothetical protein